jgi:hypothetical protein
MTQIAEPAHITSGESKGVATFTPRALFARIHKSLISIFIRNKEDDIAEGYEGSGWCDQTERDLNYDAISGRHTRRS